MQAHSIICSLHHFLLLSSLILLHHKLLPLYLVRVLPPHFHHLNQYHFSSLYRKCYHIRWSEAGFYLYERGKRENKSVKISSTIFVIPHPIGTGSGEVEKKEKILWSHACYCGFGSPPLDLGCHYCEVLDSLISVCSIYLDCIH